LINGSCIKCPDLFATCSSTTVGLTCVNGYYAKKDDKNVTTCA